MGNPEIHAAEDKRSISQSLHVVLQVVTFVASPKHPDFVFTLPDSLIRYHDTYKSLNYHRHKPA